tara:strand:+ start:4471 stop:4743 length:273 start_codon:yes stop_codon:yes gene_type:complete
MYESCLIYVVLVYLLHQQKACVQNIAVVLLISHIIKDIAFQNQSWPYFTDLIAIVFGFILFKNGQKVVGSIIILGHLRRLIFKNDKYYTF